MSCCLSLHSSPEDCGAAMGREVDRKVLGLRATAHEVGLSSQVAYESGQPKPTHTKIQEGHPNVFAGFCWSAFSNKGKRPQRQLRSCPAAKEIFRAADNGHMWISDKRAKLSAKVQQDLTERSKQGIWAHPLCVVLIAVTTGLLHRAPVLMGFAIFVTLLQSALRAWIVRCLRHDVSPRPRRLERMHIGLLLSCAAMWGVVSGSAIYAFGCHDRDVLMLLLYHAAIAFATVSLLVHDRSLMRSALMMLFLPLVIGRLFSGEAHLLSFIGAGVIYPLYCLVQGKKLNQLYEQQISDNYEMTVAAYRDCLTGLPNRLYMNQMLETCVDHASDKRRQIALLYIDLDGFKQINDRHSHKVGDLFLCEAAARISECLRAGDVAARIGGDEFTILLPECASEKEAIGLANRILGAAREPVTIDGHRLNYSTSIGVSLFPQMASSAELLVRSADEAMYAAKTSGKDRVCIAPPAGEAMLSAGEYEMPMLTFCSIGGMNTAAQLGAPSYGYLGGT